ARRSERQGGLDPHTVIDVRAVLVVAADRGVWIRADAVRHSGLEGQTETRRPANRESCALQIDAVRRSRARDGVVLVHMHPAQVEEAHYIEAQRQPLTRLEAEQNSLGATGFVGRIRADTSGSSE